MIDLKTQVSALPPGERVDADCLAESLEKSNASYKFLILKIILQRVAETDASDDLAISFDELRREMLATAWFPLQHFQLSFGSDDTIKAAQDKAIKQSGPVGSVAYSQIQQVRLDFKAQADSLAKIPDLRNPLHVMLRPWLKEEAGDSYSRIAKLSNVFFENERNPPLYKIVRNKKSIHVHPLWREYCKTNWQIINGWLDHHWQRFLTRRNPYVPHLINKLWEISERTSLEIQRELWKPYVAKNDLHCFYFPNPIGVSDYQLDHFLPWTWVTHDQLWNLIPASPDANSSKSNLLPSSNLIPALAERHRQFICFTKRHNDEEQWKKAVADYIEGLQATYDDLVKNPNIINAYEATVRPQLELAKRQGLKNWEPS